MWPASDPRLSVRFIRLRSGLSVRCVGMGPSDGPPVLMLPGWGVCAYTFRGNLPALASAGYHAMAVDLKGHGRSDKPLGNDQYRLSAMVAHAVEIMDALQLGCPAVVAQSMAGRVAIELALAHPARVASLALVSPVGLGRVSLIRLGRLSAEPVFDPFVPMAKARPVFRIALQAAYGKLGTVEPHEVDEYWAQAQFPGFIEAARSLLGHFDWDSVPERVAAVRVPVTVFRGTRDRIVRANAERIATAAGLTVGAVGGPATSGDSGDVSGPARRLRILGGAGHALNEEAPDAVNGELAAAVSGWVARTGRAALAG